MLLTENLPEIKSRRMRTSREGLKKSMPRSVKRLAMWTWKNYYLKNYVMNAK
jgi:hypothetical protein